VLNEPAHFRSIFALNLRCKGSLSHLGVSRLIGKILGSPASEPCLGEHGRGSVVKGVAGRPRPPPQMPTLTAPINPQPADLCLFWTVVCYRN